MLGGASTEDTRTDGFTLIELLVVIVVLGILAGIVTFAVGSFRSDARNASCRTDVRTLQTAGAAYLAQHGTNAHDLDALLSGGYIKSLPQSGVTFADGVTNPATVAECTGELAFTPDPPSSVPGGGSPTVIVSSVDGSTVRHDDDDTTPWQATVTVMVTDGTGAAVSSADVVGSWSDDATPAGCQTGSDGTCTFFSLHIQTSPSIKVMWSPSTVDGTTVAIGSPSVDCRYPTVLDHVRDCQPTVTT